MNRGRFGIYGGQFVPETLMPCLLELEEAFDDANGDPSFHSDLDSLLQSYSCRKNSNAGHATRDVKPCVTNLNLSEISAC